MCPNEETIMRLTPADVAETHFAFSPMLELVTSYQRFARAKPDARLRLWMDETRRTLYNTDFPYLNALASSKPYIPDFLTQPPMVNGLRIEDEIAKLLATPDENVRKNVLMLIHFTAETEVLNQFLAYPRESLYCLAEELRLYWQRALAHHWSRMRNVLEEDILYRARTLALEGYGKLIKELSPGLSYTPCEIHFNKAANVYGLDLDLKGTGLQLVPAIFSESNLLWQISPEWQPMLIYSPRGTGLWWRELPPVPDQALEIALGAGRARVLQALTTPANTGELARRLNLTDGGVSQHLNRLRQAGLVESQRSAKKVYYNLTSRGVNLLQLFDGKYDSAAVSASADITAAS